MACEVMHPSTSHNEILDELLRCMVCFESFIEPKVLQCQHSFCSECLKSWHEKGSALNKKNLQVISCPTCREDTEVPKKGISGLPGDFRSTKLTEALQLVTIQDKNEGKTCNICVATGKSQAAAYYCTKCSEQFCEECCIKHNSNSLFSDHHVVDLSETEISDKLFCTKHDSKPIKYMCQECNIFICTVCALSEHNDHEVKDLDSGVRSYATNLRDLSQKIIDKKSDVNEKYEKYTEIKVLMKGRQEEIEEEIDAHVTSISERILTSQYELEDFIGAKKFGSKDAIAFSVMTSFQEAAGNAIQKTGDAILTKLREARTSVLAECSEKHQIVMQKLNQQLDNVTFHLANVESLSSFLTDILFNKKPLELLMVYDDLMTRIYSVLETPVPVMTQCSIVTFKPNQEDYEELGMITEEEIPIDEFVVRHAFAAEASACAAANGDIDGDACLPGFPDSFPGEMWTMSKKLDKDLVTCSTENGVTLDDIQREVDNMQLAAGVNDSDNFTPPSASWMEDKVLEEILPGYSPIDINPNMKGADNKVPEEDLDISHRKGKPGLVMERLGVSKPQGKKASGAGKKQKSGAQGHSQPELRWPTDVCLLPNNEVVISDSSDKSIQVFNTDPKLWSKATNKHELNKLVKIRAYGGNHIEPMCLTTVSSQHAELLKSFNSTSQAEGQFVAVCDNKDKCIKIFDIKSKGSSMASWGKSWFMPTFKHPCGIAITANSKWVVSDVSKHTISIHDPEGSCLLQFGSKGKGNHWFQWPKYIAVDDYGRILVSDCGNNCIKAFTRHGEFLFKFGARVSMQSPGGIAFDGSGNIIVNDWQKNCVHLFSPNGQLIETLLSSEDGVASPAGVSIDHKGQMVITQTDPPAVKIYQFK